MAGEVVGNAYVNVVPRVEGNAQSVGSEVGSKLSGGMKGTFGAGAVALGNILSNALTSVASSVGEQFSKTFWNYADFEQLSGGVEKIFDQADTAQILKDAQGAFKDLNMSVNDYLTSINQVGASFAQTMGDQKGYDIARKGMLAISDYASGTGRNLEELNEKYSLITRSTSSYQSIADQFSGILPATSSDFLEQAKAAGFLSDEYTKLTEVPVAEYQEAVTQMLEKGVADMGLAGNTAKESATTLSGSIAMLGSAWDNFLTAVGDGGQQMDLQAVMDGLLESLGAVAMNVGPALARIGETLVTELPVVLATSLESAREPILLAINDMFGFAGVHAATSLMESLSTALAPMVANIGVIFTNMQSIIMQAVAPLAQLLAPIVTNLVSILVSAVSTILDALASVTGFVSGSIMPTVQTIASTITPIIDMISADVTEAMDEIFDSTGESFDGVLSLAEEVWPVIGETIGEVVGAVAEAVKVAWPVIKQVASTVFGSVKSIVQTVWPTVSDVIRSAVTAAKNVVSNAIGAIRQVFGTIRSIVGTVKSTFDGVRKAVSEPIEAAKRIVSDAVSSIKGMFPFSIGNMFTLKLPHFSVSGGSFPWGVGGKGQMPSWSVSWYKRGGVIDGATLIGAGESGAEFIWPSYDPYMAKYAKAIADNMPTSNGGITVNFTYNGEGDATDAVNLLTSNLRQLRATGAF